MDAQIALLQSRLDLVWVLVAAALVMLMQVGFLLLEAGFVRSKNSINVALKNVCDFAIAVIGFCAVGFALMFSASHLGLFGIDFAGAWEALGNKQAALFILFQVMFVGTAATIASGVVAERMTFGTYLILSAIVSMVVYPVFGHWAWGNAFVKDNAPLLASQGFLDFAGSTVVHSVGAWIGLAAVIVIGPRIGRFDENGRPRQIQGHSPVLAATGGLVLWVGWIGFNGGSTLAANEDVVPIVLNTMLGGAAGALFAIGAGRLLDGCYRADRIVNGSLAGLVAITAGCNLVSAQSAVVMGMLGAFFAFLAAEIMERYLHVDDAVGAVPVHGVAGVAGTVMVALFAPVEALPAGGRWEQFLVQLQGAGLAFAWAFGSVWVLMMAIKPLVNLRVSPEEEMDGLNQAEHGASLGTGELQKMLGDVIQGKADLSKRIEVEPGDEAAEVASLFNRLLDKLQDKDKEERNIAAAERARFEAERSVVEDIRDIVARAADGDLSGRLDVAGKTGVLREVGDGINRLVDALSSVMQSLSTSLVAMSNGDLGARIEVTGSGEFAIVGNAYNASLDMLRQVTGDAGEASEAMRNVSSILTLESGQLAERSHEQSSRVSGLSKRLEAASAAFAQYAASAAQVGATARSASGLASDGSKAVERMLAEIEAARKVATEASSIIGFIKDIAFQTNLLAINAAVEAAHAGESGRGFAIVAQEVRSLAQRTTEATQQIEQILGDTDNAVGRGASSARDAGDVLKRLSAAVIRAAEEVDAVVEASSERMADIRVIGEAVQAVGHVTRDNEAAVQRVLGVSQTLDEQAQRLEAVLSHFAAKTALERAA